MRRLKPQERLPSPRAVDLDSYYSSSQSRSSCPMDNPHSYLIGDHAGRVVVGRGGNAPIRGRHGACKPPVNRMAPADHRHGRLEGRCLIPSRHRPPTASKPLATAHYRSRPRDRPVTRGAIAVENLEPEKAKILT